jgi:hypothetical protein
MNGRLAGGGRELPMPVCSLDTGLPCPGACMAQHMRHYSCGKTCLVARGDVLLLWQVIAARRSNQGRGEGFGVRCPPMLSV